MTKNEKKIFTQWVNDRHDYDANNVETANKIDEMYRTNGGQQTMLTVIDKIAYLTTLDEDTRYKALITLTHYATNYLNDSIRRSLANRIANADKIIKMEGN